MPFLNQIRVTALQVSSLHSYALSQHVETCWKQETWRFYTSSLHIQEMQFYIVRTYHKTVIC